MKRSGASSLLGVITALCLLVGPLRASADGSTDAAARADGLFKSGKERMAQGFYAQACAMFAESFRLDPATGSLLALALCHERDEKLKSARDNYLAAATRAHQEGQLERERAATARAEALAPHVPQLTVEAKDVDPSLGALFLNGEALRPEQLNQPIPLDGGTAYLDLRDPDGNKLWSTQANVPAVQGRAIVVVPSLRGPQPSAPRPAAGATPARAAELPSSRAVKLKRLGVGLLSAGGAGLALGLGFSLRAILKNNDSNAGCDGDICHGDARESRLEARRAGNAATLSLSFGAVFAASGLATYFYGGKRASSKLDARRLPAPWVSPHGGGASIQGAF